MFSKVVALKHYISQYIKYDGATQLNGISRCRQAQLWRHLVVRLSMLVGLPVLIYLSVFYVHLSILTKAGPHDDVMSSVFQSSLEV